MLHEVCQNARPALPAAARVMVCALLVAALPEFARASGTPAGTVVDNLATVAFEVAGVPGVQDSNTVTFAVLERADVAVVLQSGQVAVAPGETAAELLFAVTNTGNGNDTITLAVDSVLGGDDFDPVPATPAIYFDTDSSGDLTAGDIAYAAGNNDPLLAADETIFVLVVNDIPALLSDGALGLSRLTATSDTGAGLPGTTLAGAGDGGLDVVIGGSGGSAGADGEYRVAAVDLSVVKSVAIADPFGGSEPTVGATLTYTITVQVQNGGTATAGVLRDPIPAASSYVPASLSLNGSALTDAVDPDAGEYDTSGAPAVVVRLPDLTQADGPQVIEFSVTID